jgi:hypothetical protein
VREPGVPSGKRAHDLLAYWIPGLEGAVPRSKTRPPETADSTQAGGGVRLAVTRPSTAISRTALSARTVSGLSGSTIATQTRLGSAEGTKNDDSASFSGGDWRSRSIAYVSPP